MNFGEYVVSAGYTKPMTSDPSKYYFKTDSLMYFRKFGGSNIEQMYQRIGTQDPLITVAPNALRTPTWNVYPYDNLYDSAPETLTKLPRFYELHIENPLRRHYIEPFDLNDYHAQKFVDLVYPKFGRNILCEEEAEYMRNLEKILSTVSKTNEFNKGKYVPPFDKCNPVLKEHIARFVCDRFLSVLPDTDRDEFINTGFFNIAIGLGARYDIAKIQELIKKLTPVKDGVDLNNIHEIKDYIKDSAFYREMMSTNRYLALISTLNMMFNCSDMSRVGFYANENSPYITACKNVISNRDLLSPYTYRTFMKEISKIYYELLSNPDRTFFASPQDESRLLGVCQILDSSKTKK